MKNKLPHKSPEVILNRVANHMKCIDELFKDMHPRSAFLCLNRFYLKLARQVAPEHRPQVYEQLVHLCDELGFTLIKQGK